MTRNQYNEPDENIEDDVFCFFEFFFVTSWDEYEPSCIDNEYDTDDPEKCIEIVEYISHDPYACLDILIFDRTFISPEEFTFLTIWRSIYRWDKCSRETYEEESDDSVYDDILSFFEFFLISSTRHDHEECIDHHRKKSETRENLEHPNERWENIHPHLPSEDRWYTSIWIVDHESIPYGECKLHDEYTDRNVDNIGFPFFHSFLIPSCEEELQDTDNEKYHSDREKEIFYIKCDLDKSIQYSTSSSCRIRSKEEFIDWLHESSEHFILISAIADICISYIEITFLYRTKCVLKRKKSDKSSQKNQKNAHRRESYFLNYIQLSREMQFLAIWFLFRSFLLHFFFIGFLFFLVDFFIFRDFSSVVEYFFLDEFFFLRVFLTRDLQ